MKKITLFLSVLITVSTLSSGQNTIAFTPTKIILQIPDTVVNNTVIKRKAELFTMTYNMAKESLALTWTVKHYSDSAGSYGSYLCCLVPDKIKETIADNHVIVDATNGQFVYPDAEGNWTEEIPLIGQYNFFNALAEGENINVHDLIRAYGLQADWNYNLK